MLHRRGGVAAGEASRNPTDTTYAAVPPSSTYTGPKVAGTYGGFVGVLVGSGIFVLVLVLVLIFFRLRQLKRRAASHAAIRRAGATATARSGTDGGDEWDTMDDAFEMPRASAAGYDPANLNESTLTLDRLGAAAAPPRASPLPLYAQDGVSQEAFFDSARGRGPYDPYVTNSPDPERRDPVAPHQEKATEG
ncbi:hypothetical protein JCM1841_006328 [Sporobolomyces salmonicolor]